MVTATDHPRELGHPATTATVHAAAALPEQSAVSWGAILAGAAGAAALSLILLILGMGLGLSSVSPWAFEGVSAETFGWSTIAWITFTSIAASGLGGYLAGRLRTRWVSLHGDESYFRDTAHGFLSWAVATLVTATVLTSAIGGILGTGIKATTAVAGAATGAVATAAGGLAAAGGTDLQEGDLDYWVDTLFRRSAAPAAAQSPTPVAATPGAPATTTGTAINTNTRPADMVRTASPADADADDRAEVARIFFASLRNDSIDQADAQYVAQRIAERTGISQAEAEARVAEVQTRLRTALDDAETAAREAADEARKASAYAALWLFITLLIGAFFASLLATFGGRRRDL